jgi:hypothetical protein
MNHLAVIDRSKLIPKYDLFLCASGAEERAKFVASEKLEEAVHRKAIFYNREDTAIVRSNERYFRSAGYRPFPVGGASLRNEVISQIEKASQNEGSSFCIDISCMTREHLARWIFCLATAGLNFPLVVDFVYSHALFSEPPSEVGLAKMPTPVIPELAGYFDDPSYPSMLVVGLGYEPYLALGFLEMLDPTKVVAFVPAHHDPRYTAAIAAQNQTFFEYVKNEAVLNYDVFNPFETFHRLDSVLSGARGNHRLNLAPFGPKVFVLASMLAAIANYPSVFVWHLNSESLLASVGNRRPSGKISVLRVVASAAK